MTESQPAISNQVCALARTLLIVEDDKPFLQRLSRAMERRGFEVITADSVAGGLSHIEKRAPDFAVVDMRLSDGSGLEIISALKQRRSDARAIILTGYSNIATAVKAVKIGAIDYLAKPADADDVAASLLALNGAKAGPPDYPMSAGRVRWEHIQRIRRAALICIGAPCSGFLQNERRGNRVDSDNAVCLLREQAPAT